MNGRRLMMTAGAASLALAGVAHAQRADENVVRVADDAFGVSVGNERIGLYNDRDTRGFNPVTAANVRMEGFFFDARTNIPGRLIDGSTIRVGLTAQSFPFPAPTGIVDYQLRNFGDQRVFSAFGLAGANNSFSLETDFRAPIDGRRFGFAGGVFLRHEEVVPGDNVDIWGMGLVNRWRPRQGVEVATFYGRGSRFNDVTTPFVFTSGAFLPPEIEATNWAEDFTESNGYIESYGVLARAPLNDTWSFGASLLRHNNGSDGPTTELYLNTNQAGLASTHRFIDQPGFEQRSISAETRLTGVFRGENLRHTVHLSLRARDQRRHFGGSATVNFGPAQIGVTQNLSDPIFVYQPQLRDNAMQFSANAGYALALRRVGEASIGLQRVSHEFRVTGPGGVSTTTDEPLLLNVSGAITAIPRVAFYAGFTQGLEEVATAPEFASNASEAPPAIRTEQYDYGLRYAITPRLSLVLGYFNIERPYFNVDGANLYRQLGVQRHSGVEFSLAGQLNERLNVVAGAVFMDPVVTGDAVNAGQIGPRPVGQADQTLRINLDYRAPWLNGLSLDAALAYSSARAATTRTFVALGGRQLETDDLATLDLGMRYRFRAQGMPATFRVQVQNVSDAFAWRVLSTGALFVSDPRYVQASLALDF